MNYNGEREKERRNWGKLILNINEGASFLYEDRVDWSKMEIQSNYVHTHIAIN